MYVYIKVDNNLYIVGHYAPDSDNDFVPESDHRSVDSAARRVHYLNGGN